MTSTASPRSPGPKRLNGPLQNSGGEATTRLIIPACGGYDVEPCHRQPRWIHQLMQVAGKGHGWPFCRVRLDLRRNDFGQRVAEVVAWPGRMHLIGETRWEHVSVSADNVCPDTHLGDGLDGAEPMRQASTGVQRNRLPHRGDPGFVHPMVTQEARRGVGTFDFESLITVGVLGDPEVVQDAAEEYQFVVIVDIRLQSLGSGELTGKEVAAQAVMGHECRRDIEHELFCRAGDVGIWEIDPTGQLACVVG